MTAPAGRRHPPSIHVLGPEVASRIAAGEVIERPASIVRELLDNAIDAGAGRITLEIEEGGIGLIRVTDDGRGIPPEELELAFERHATSKIAVLDDLHHVRTLGFRGEALPSIAAAADVEIVSREHTEPVGVHAVFIDARVVRRHAKPAPPGTSLAVRDLFARIPARRKFLSTAASEARAIATLAAHYALAYPGIAFQFTNNGRRALVTSGDDDLRHAFAAIYGGDSASAMLDVSLGEAGVEVSGLAGPPPLHRGNRSAISLFVNGRWVQSRALTFAIVDAYHSQLPLGRHPIAALTLAVPDEDVDVNVHPAKAEVRFRDERAVARSVRHAVTAALESAAPVGMDTPGSERPGWGPVPVPLPPVAEPGPPAILQHPQPAQAALRLSRADPTPAALGGSRPHRELLPLLRVVGQMASTYIVAEGPDGMYLVDQHAAHERVVYDRIVAARAASGPPPQQSLLDPLLLDLDVAGAATVAEFQVHLDASGLELEAFGERAYLVRAVPAGLDGADAIAAIRALVDQLQEDRRVTDPFSRAAATVACHSSVRAGAALALEEMRRLLDDLGATASPRTCPHGRPTLVHMGTDIIERQFGRR